MPFQPTSRYPSPWAGQPRTASATATDAGDLGGTVMIDGLEVVDEQVVVLSPSEPEGDDAGPRRPARTRRPRERGGRRGMG